MVRIENNGVVNHGGEVIMHGCVVVPGATVVVLSDNDSNQD
jgi:hypothetical protein